MSRAQQLARFGCGSMLVVFVSLSAAPAGAVPVFSRKYQTSCQTCHTIFPKLNPFGQAFRLNGYRMPAETEEQIKEKPVSLGSDAQKRMFPDMVYPNSLPGNAPFALNVKMASVWSSTHDDTGTQTIVTFGRSGVGRTFPTRSVSLSE